MPAFEWDAAKREATLLARKIDFADIVRAFERPMLTTLDDRKDYGEPRWRSLVMLDGRVLAIVYTSRGADVIRLISARKANAEEVESYRSAYPTE